MASPSSIREVRARVGTSFATTHDDASGDSWALSNGVIHKLRAVSVDTAGLEQPGIDDETMQTRMHNKPAMIAGLRKGSIRLSTYAEGAYSNVGETPAQNIAAACAGGIANPVTNRTDAAEAAVSTVNVAATGCSSFVATGQAALLGVRGDGKGGGEIRPINSLSGDDHMGLSVATAGAVDTGDAIVYSTTIYPDEDATQKYVDFLVIGHAAADQVQTIGAVGTFTMGGMGIGELPLFEFDFNTGDWQYAPSGARASLATTTDPYGGEPPFERGIGVVHVGDQGSSTRTSYRCTDVTFDPGLANEEQPGPAGVNGMDGQQHMPGVPTLELTILTGEDDGVLDDFPSTSKHVLVQLGHQATKAMAIELQNASLQGKPQRVEVNNLTGWRCVFFGKENTSGSTDLDKASWRVHCC